MGSVKWALSAEEKEKYIRAMTDELAPLRARAGITQGELANILGVSRQTYSAVETGRAELSWSTYLSLVWFFDNNLATMEQFRELPAYPERLFERINTGIDLKTKMNGMVSDDLMHILEALDEPAIHALKTLLLVEYARCRKIPGEVVVKAFEGMDLLGESADAAADRALKRIRKRQP